MHRATVAVALCLASASDARAATPVDAIGATLQSQIGSWNCTIVYPGERDAQRFVVVTKAYGDRAIAGTVDLPAYARRSARKAAFSLAYDRANKRWIDTYTDSLGASSVFGSNAQPGAKRLTFAQLYPVDTPVATSVLVLGEQTTTVDTDWTVAGTQRASHEVCAKIPD